MEFNHSSTQWEDYIAAMTLSGPDGEVHHQVRLRIDPNYDRSGPYYEVSIVPPILPDQVDEAIFKITDDWPGDLPRPRHARVGRLVLGNFPSKAEKAALDIEHCESSIAEYHRRIAEQTERLARLRGDVPNLTIADVFPEIL